MPTRSVLEHNVCFPQRVSKNLDNFVDLSTQQRPAFPWISGVLAKAPFAALKIEMIKENFDLIIVGLVAVSIAMYDMVIDLTLNILDLLFERLHILFEWLELSLEHAVEHMFYSLRPRE